MWLRRVSTKLEVLFGTNLSAFESAETKRTNQWETDWWERHCPKSSDIISRGTKDLSNHVFVDFYHTLHCAVPCHTSLVAAHIL